MKPLETSPTYVPTRFAKSLLRLAEQRKFDIPQILLNTGLNFNPLDASSPDHISVIHYSLIYQQVLTLLQDDSFGMPPGKGMSAGAFRMMCFAIINCGTLFKAVKRVTEFLEVFYDPEMHLKFTQQDNIVTISYPNYKENEQSKGQTGEAYGLALWHRFFSWLVGQPIKLISVRLISPEPVNTESFAKLFGVKANFGCSSNGIDFNSQFLELPICQNELSLRDFLRTAPYHMMVAPKEAHTSELVNKVRRVMGYDFSKSFPNFEDVASALNVSPPTLRRHLHREGVSYQGLKDRCRKETAIAYLSRPELTVSAVSALMGFMDTSTFHRSFKKWTGLTPGKYRKVEFAIEEISD